MTGHGDTQMTGHDTARDMVAASERAELAAIECLKVGAVFLGARHIVDAALGGETNSGVRRVAIDAACRVFERYDIFTDACGVITRIAAR